MLAFFFYSMVKFQGKGAMYSGKKKDKLKTEDSQLLGDSCTVTMTVYILFLTAKMKYKSRV